MAWAWPEAEAPELRRCTWTWLALAAGALPVAVLAGPLPVAAATTLALLLQMSWSTLVPQDCGHGSPAR